MQKSELLMLAAFAGVKFVGYLVFAVSINKRVPGLIATPWVVALVRAVVGIAVGLAVASIVTGSGSRMGIVTYALMAPVRMCEWLIVLALFFRPLEGRGPQFLKLAAMGTVLSYVLDVPAIICALMVPGRLFVC